MTAAASKLAVTQPAVSQQIRNLESVLGVTLMMKGVRGDVRLTAQGQYFYNHARKILHLTQGLEATVQTLFDDLEGSIQVATLNTIGLSLVTPIIGTILNPIKRKISMGLSYGSGSEVVEKMKNQEVDVAILPDLKEQYGLDMPEYSSQFLFKDDLLFVGSGKDPTLPKILSIKDIENRPIVSFKNLFPKFKYLLYQSAAKNKVALPNPMLESNNIGTLKRIIELWMCWGFLPLHSIHKQVRMRRLSVIQLEEFSYSMNIKAYYKVNQNERIQKIIDVFLMLIQKQCSIF